MLKMIAKFCFSFGLIIYLVHSGKLSLDLVAQCLAQPTTAILAIGIFVGNLGLAAYRWLSMVRLKSTREIPFFTFFQLNWIGQFFSTILPGAVTGDLVKVVYARKFDPQLSKTYLITSVLFDRILGLCGLILLMGLSTAFYYNELIHLSENMKRLIHFNVFFFWGMIAFLVSVFLPGRIQAILLSVCQKVPLMGKHIAKTLEQIWHIGRHKKTVGIMILVSMLIQMLNVFAFWILTHNFIKYQPDHTVVMEFAHAFIFFPIGLISTVIPVTPGGLGVGHLLFDKLFAHFQVINGADLFNIYFIATLFVNLIGIFPYMLLGTKDQQAFKVQV